MPSRRTVFFLSDRTGITAEMLGNSLLSQFEDVAFKRITIPFVDSPEKVEEAIRLVNETSEIEERRPIVFSSVVDEDASETIRARTKALTLDLFQIFIAPLFLAAEVFFALGYKPRLHAAVQERALKVRGSAPDATLTPAN